MNVAPSTVNGSSPLPKGQLPTSVTDDGNGLVRQFAEAMERKGKPLRETAQHGASQTKYGQTKSGEVLMAGKLDIQSEKRFQPRDMKKQERDEPAADQAQASVTSLAPGQGPLVVPAAPAPHTDPTAFADLLARLWLREREQRTREVRVNFGEAAWPATGARMVRGADGRIDIAVIVGDRDIGVEEGLGTLRERLGARGLIVGTLDIEAGI